MMDLTAVNQSGLTQTTYLFHRTDYRTTIAHFLLQEEDHRRKPVPVDKI